MRSKEYGYHMTHQFSLGILALPVSRSKVISGGLERLNIPTVSAVNMTECD